jgi:hypothetical protein
MVRTTGFVAALALTVSAPPTSATMVQSRDGDIYARVTMLMYSGRRDPVWILTPEQSKLFVAKLKALPRSTAAQNIPEGLGYKGFSVHIGVQQDVRVFRNIVLLYDHQMMTAHVDSRQSLEKWLIKTKPKALPADISDGIRGNKT